MTKTKWLLAILVSCLVYTILSISAGETGIIAYNQLKMQKKEISLQAMQIQKINTELVLEKTALEKDKDVIAAYARKLDYVSPSEKLVKITGLRPYEASLYDTGTVVRRQAVSFMDEKFCKGAALIFFVLFTLLFALSSPKERKKNIGHF
ncbi:MAG: septum formation initiator family protein [Treponema sp.]|nr:septum formation initiator family protein [Treponema sp.]